MSNKYTNPNLQLIRRNNNYIYGNSKPSYARVVAGRSSQSTPAYTTVSSQQQSTESPAIGANSWPPSLQELVTSIFNRAGPRKDEVAITLRDYIARVKQRDEIFTTDWNNVVIPGLEEFTRKKRGFSDIPLSSSPASASLGQHESRKMPKVSTKDWKINFVPSTGSQKWGNQGISTSSFTNRSQMSSNSENNGSQEFTNEPIIGTSTKLEKRYLRLTSAPDPAAFRPEHILKEAIKMLKDRWKKDRDYSYICDQLKAIRQDLTVQMIRNEFTVEVYELHARIALEKHDLGEYNQCQTQLQQLYETGLKGNEYEFIAYRLLYFVHTKNSTAMMQFMTDLISKQRKDPWIRHALDVRTAVASSNYHQLKYLYVNSPNMASYLMDGFMERERVKALEIMTKAYRPNVSLQFVTQELGFQTTQDTVDVEACKLFLAGFQDAESPEIKVITDDDMIDCKAAYPLFLEAGRKYGKVDIKGQI